MSCGPAVPYKSNESPLCVRKAFAASTDTDFNQWCACFGEHVDEESAAMWFIDTSVGEQISWREPFKPSDTELDAPDTGPSCIMRSVFVISSALGFLKSLPWNRWS